MARSALQWLPSALRSGLLVLAAFSPLVAYSAGACVRVYVCVYACALFSIDNTQTYDMYTMRRRCRL